jgi:serine/threonine protein kinase/dipeptidyl aminopeptidase/acylaminoacyl peptidase
VTLPREAWPRLKEAFEGARALALNARPAYLTEVCNGDESLRHEVELLLAHHDQAASFLETPVTPFDDSLVAKTLEGQCIGPYQVAALIGTGGMGEVYSARDTTLNRLVAIKVLLPALANDPDRLVRFSREAQLLASLNHPHVAQIHGFENAGGLHALVMELVEGPTLADRIAQGAIPVAEALAIAKQIAEALAAAHAQGIIHRDLKPANIKVRPDGTVKVLDFGLAKAIDSTSSDCVDAKRLPAPGVLATGAGLIVGTAAYMSPEQARRLPVDTRADIWAFGCVFHEMLTGRRPFAGETIPETLAAILEHELDWNAFPSSTPAGIRELLRRCLQRDLALRLQNIAEARETIEKAQRGSNRWRVAALSAAVVGTLAVSAVVWWREPARPVDRSEWVQLTQFPDSVIHPALSPDGRMLAFIRSPSGSTPFGFGQVFVKRLPNGEPVQLTNDKLAKLSPVFSPDGSRIAYGTVNPGRFEWDMWTVPVLGGEPQPWLRNASGLVWSGPGRILFSEMKKNPHMGIVTARESRIDQRDVYLPAHGGGMAHRSCPSPDGRSVLVVEMDHDFFWMPCRLVGADGSPGRQVGPSGGGCTFATWSPDGRWMYFTSNAGGTNHIWRQRFPGGQAEQITSGPTEEAGIAMAPDGRSFVTAVAVQNVSAWLHDPNGERQILLEGNTVDVRFTADGKKLFYKVVKQASSSWNHSDIPGELRLMDLETGRSDVVMPGFQTLNYDLSVDGQQVVMEIADRDGTSRFWIAMVDRASAPRPIPGVEGKEPGFGRNGDILFRRTEGSSGFVYRVRPDGTGMQKVFEKPIFVFGGMSRDGRWIKAFTVPAGNEGPSWQALPLDGGSSVPIGAYTWHWSASEDSVAISGAPLPAGRSYLVPLRSGQFLPLERREGARSEQEVADLPGARRIDADMVVPGPSPEIYAFYRTTTQRNLYRIPIR